jgi:hypothetical protein
LRALPIPVAYKVHQDKRIKERAAIDNDVILGLRWLPGDHPTDHCLHAFLLWHGRWRYETYVDHFKPESDDPLYDSPKGSLIWQLGAKGRRARAYDDLAVVKFCVQCRTGLTYESDLVRLWSHQDYASQSVDQARHAAPR